MDGPRSQVAQENGCLALTFDHNALVSPGMTWGYDDPYEIGQTRIALENPQLSSLV
jgi:hypothetical protein